jgi:hypothetical protein
MNMKRIISTIAFLTGILGFAVPVLAASDFNISLPSDTIYKPGQTFSANISVSPTEKIYTVKVQLDYPANLLKVESFSFSSNWMPVSQEGLDKIDNSAGLLIKTAGYPGGLTSVKTIGKVTFKALNNGQGVIQLTSDSFALNAQNTNVTGILGASQITINTPVVQEGAPQEEETIPSEEVVAPVEEEEIIPAEEQIEEEATNPLMYTIHEEDLLADIEALSTRFEVLLWLSITAGIILVVLKLTKKKKA